ncbi:MAG: carbohydrate ABC transporter permease [Clostridiales bacterium]|nr:carbohydrate ABC transporter permease [Clostridiales bacterium]
MIVQNKIRKTRADQIFDAINVTIMVVILLIVLYPLYFTIIASVSQPEAVASGEVIFYPKGFSLESYENVFKSDTIWRGYLNTVIYTVGGVMFSLFLTVPLGYVRSKQNLPGQKFFAWYFLIPMYFGGGLAPTYLMVKSYGLLNKPYTLIVLGSLSLYYAIVARTFFSSSIPRDIYESAEIDGASEFTVFFRIALPLSKPILATLVLFFASGRWNTYFNALIYVTKQELAPLQIVLRNILLLNQNALSMMTEDIAENQELMESLIHMSRVAQTMKYALIFVSCAPLLVAYPFVQKYFVKGVMIGSLKG